jgi:hypothetical protein
MNNLLSIDGDKIVIEKLRVKFTEGPITHAGNLEVVGQSKFNDGVAVKGNADISGTITADTINVKHIICDEPGGLNDPFAFTANTAKELDGKGFHFTDGNATRQFVFKENGRMWSTMNLDLSRGNSYQIENIPVLTMTALGDSVVKSSLQSVGTLHKLKVGGDVEFAEWAFFNSVHNRLGINTDSPNGAIGIVENNVELVLSSYKPGVGYVGTFNNTDLELGTDNTSRVVIKNTGEVVFGSAKYKNAVIRIHGKLEVDELVNDPREGKFLPLTFKAGKDTSIYGTGIVWMQDNSARQFTYAANPDRILSSEIIDLADDKWYSIGSAMVLSRASLGASVTSSSLTKLGSLESLEVLGSTTLNNLTASTVSVLGTNQFTLDSTGITTANSFIVTCDNEQEFKIDSNDNIELGNKQNTARKLSLFGQVSVNANNPEPDVALTVNGNLSFANKKFITGTNKPTTGTYRKGDICWNTEPEATAYVGWVCIKEGTPGEWLPFGQISNN